MDGVRCFVYFDPRFMNLDFMIYYECDFCCFAGICVRRCNLIIHECLCKSSKLKEKAFRHIIGGGHIKLRPFVQKTFSVSTSIYSFTLAKERTHICFESKEKRATRIQIDLSSWFSWICYLLLILYSSGDATSDHCLSHCGGFKILYSFGIGMSWYLEKSYEIRCQYLRSRKPSSDSKFFPISKGYGILISS